MMKWWWMQVKIIEGMQTHIQSTIERERNPVVCREGEAIRQNGVLWITAVRSHFLGGFQKIEKKEELLDIERREGSGSKEFQFTKICKSPRLTVMFSGIKICVSSPMPMAHILNWYW
jgi:hypothetical protein